MFIQDDDSDTLSFDSLTCLYVAGDRFIEYEDFHGQIQSSNKVWPKLAFPCLTDLTIHELPLADDAVEAIMSAPLKSLVFRGQSAQARLLCRYKISGLNELNLVFDMDVEPSIDHFYQFSNDIFHRTGGITIVKCSVNDHDYKIDWSMIDWPHVTHLYVYHISDFGKLLETISAMPNLVQLWLVISLNNRSNTASFVATLNGLKQKYTQPSSSNIEKLTVLQPRANKSLDKALEELKWYLPKLKQITKN